VAVVAVGAGCSRPSLQPVVVPDLSSLERTVQKQIRDRHAALTETLRTPGTVPAEAAVAYGNLGRLLMAARFNEQAVSCYLHAEAAAPEDMRWSYYLGQAYLRQGDRGRAAAAFVRASHLRPTDPNPFIWLGETYLDDARPDEAQSAFGRALSLQPQSAAALFGAGRAALARRAYPDAVQYLERALAAAARASAVHYPLAMAYRALGESEKAQVHLRQRGDATPELDDPLMQPDDDVLDSAVGSEHRGMQALRRTDWPAAIGEFRKGLELKPDDLTLRYWLGAALYASGDAAGAEKEFRAVVQREPHDAKAHFSLGAIDDAAGRRRQAIEEYSTAVKDDPTLPDARLRLADALRTSGQLQASMAHYERAVDLDPRIADAWIGGAHALIDLGRYDQAREWLFRARRVHPDRKELSDLEARLPRRGGVNAGDSSRGHQAASR
jgi:tetratricopeptide (TPR) repeat protein